MVMNEAFHMEICKQTQIDCNLLVRNDLPYVMKIMGSSNRLNFKSMLQYCTPLESHYVTFRMKVKEVQYMAMGMSWLHWVQRLTAQWLIVQHYNPHHILMYV